MDAVLDRFSEFWETLLSMLPDGLQSWSPPALERMQLAPHGFEGNPLMLQGFTWDAKHERMSWWQHLEEEMSSLQEMGFSQIWLPPPNKAMRPMGQGYDAYDLWDLGEFDQKGARSTRWGTKDELLALSTAAAKCRIDILIDAVLNHKLGADRPEACLATPVDPADRHRDLGPTREVEVRASNHRPSPRNSWTVWIWSGFDFPGREGKYSSLTWSHEHFTGVDYDARTKTTGVFRLAGHPHQGWSPWVDKENGNYDYLLGIDIDHRHPDVRRDLFTWGEWVLKTTNASGYRLDAIKHMDRRFLREFLTRSRQVDGRSKLFAVAEYWSANIHLIVPYIKAFKGLTAFFDVPLHYNFHRASKEGSNFDLRTIFDDTITSIRPDDAVTFVDNHDTQIGQTLESWVYDSFKLHAYALILLRGQGHPCVFYGDLYPNHECYNAEIADKLKIIIRARKEHAFGELLEFTSGMNCIGFVRVGNERHARGCVVVTSNAHESGELHSIKMRAQRAALYRPLLDASSPETRTDQDGMGDFLCRAGTVEVWVPAE